MSKNFQKGIALYIVLIIMAIVLAIVLGITTILLKQIKITNKIQDSTKAYYSAESGMEMVLKDIKDNGIDGIDPDDDPDYETSSYKVSVVCSASFSCPSNLSISADCDGPGVCIYSKGTSNYSERAIEIKYNYPDSSECPFAQVIDYDYQVCPADIYGPAAHFGYDYHPKLAQFFIAEQDYVAVSMDVPITRGGLPGDINIGIQEVINYDPNDPDDDPTDDFPSGTWVCEKKIDGNQLPVYVFGTTVWKFIVFDGPSYCSLEKDKMYAIVAENTDGAADSQVFWQVGLYDDLSRPICGLHETPCLGRYLCLNGSDWKRHTDTNGLNACPDPFIYDDDSNVFFPNPNYDEQPLQLLFKLWQCT
jgi:hypothetical protein